MRICSLSCLSNTSYNTASPFPVISLRYLQCCLSLSCLSDAPYIITWTFLCSPSQKDCQHSEWQKWSKERRCREKVKVTSYCTQEGSVWLFRSTSQARTAATASFVVPICLANIMKFCSSGLCVTRNLHWQHTREARHWYNSLKGFSCLSGRELSLH